MQWRGGRASGVSSRSLSSSHSQQAAANNASGPALYSRQLQVSPFGTEVALRYLVPPPEIRCTRYAWFLWARGVEQQCRGLCSGST